MDCFCYLRNVHDKMADGKKAFENRERNSTNQQFPSEYWLTTSQLLWLRAGKRVGRGGRSGVLMIGDHEDLPESEAA